MATHRAKSKKRLTSKDLYKVLQGHLGGAGFSTETFITLVLEKAGGVEKVAEAMAKMIEGGAGVTSTGQARALDLLLEFVQFYNREVAKYQGSQLDDVSTPDLERTLRRVLRNRRHSYLLGAPPPTKDVIPGIDTPEVPASEVDNVGP